MKYVKQHFVTGIFLSTPSARRATTASLVSTAAGSYFYPRPPRGGRPPALFSSSRHARISIHALREEGDRSGSRSGRARPISIHALREEGDPP